MRTIIELRTEQLDALDAACRRDSISRAEAVRRAVDAWLARDTRAQGRKAYGLWRGRGVDGLAYQRAIRREWEP